MIRQMAIAIALLGINDLGRLIIPLFFLIDHFLYRVSTFCKNVKKIYRLDRSLNFFQNTPSNSVHFSSSIRLSVRRFQMPLVKFGENVGNIWNYLRNGFPSLG